MTWDDPVRRAALDVLRAVDERDAYANLLLPRLLRERGITGRDAAFATALVHGSLRQQGTYDAVLARCVDRPLAQLDAVVRDVLRLGCHQLLELRTPAHAAVATSVDLVRSVAGPRPAGFVNAVLRQVAARSRESWLAAIVPTAATPVERLALTTSHPRWAVEVFAHALESDLGSDLEETRAALEADNAAPPVTLVARPGRCEMTELLEAGAVAGQWSPYAAVLDAGDPADIPAVREGRAGVQDEGSQLVALALAAAALSGPDRRWLDLCAGPGGKAALLAGLAAERGAGVLASDLRLARAGLVRKALRGAPGVLGVVVVDGHRPAWQPAVFDRVLLDAPCTGLGALRRRPEARWRRRPDDVAALQRLQRGLLHTAVESARPGGVVVYATCSPHPAETRGVVDTVLADRSDLTEEDARAVLPQVGAVGSGPHVQLWPHRHGTDAMFVALLRRSAG